MQAWREPRTCGDCEELRATSHVGIFGEVVEWHECRLDGHKARKEDRACPVLSERVGSGS